MPLSPSTQPPNKGIISVFFWCSVSSRALLSSSGSLNPLAPEFQGHVRLLLHYLLLQKVSILFSVQHELPGTRRRTLATAAAPAGARVLALSRFSGLTPPPMAGFSMRSNMLISDARVARFSPRATPSGSLLVPRSNGTVSVKSYGLV